MPALINGRRFDLRIYVVCGEVPYFYARSVGAGGIITNWSQVGRLEKNVFMKRVPKEKMAKAKEYALRAAAALGFNFTGVDVIFSEDYTSTYLLELQSFPGFERGFNLISFLLSRI